MLLYSVKRSLHKRSLIDIFTQHIGDTHNLTLWWIFQTCGSGRLWQIRPASFHKV